MNVPSVGQGLNEPNCRVGDDSMSDVEPGPGERRRVRATGGFVVGSNLSGICSWKIQACTFVAALLLWAPCRGDGPATVYNELPVVVVTDIEDIGSGNRKPFFGQVDGKKWFFKHDAPAVIENDLEILHGNFEAERIMEEILTHLGIRSPHCRVVYIQGLEGRFLMVEHIDDVSPGEAGHFSPEAAAAAPFDREKIRQLMMIDVLTGNCDRHERNVFLYEDENGVWLPIPIDHDLCFPTLSLFKNGSKWPLLYDTKLGSIPLLVQKNPMYQILLGEENAANLCHKTLATVIEDLDEGYVRDMIWKLDDKEFCDSDPNRRRTEIFYTLLRRIKDMEALDPEALLKALGGGQSQDTTTPAESAPTGNDPEAVITKTSEEPIAQSPAEATAQSPAEATAQSPAEATAQSPAEATADLPVESPLTPPAEQ